MKKQHMKV